MGTTSGEATSSDVEALRGALIRRAVSEGATSD
jgi:hypothetical protein